MYGLNELWLASKFVLQKTPFIFDERCLYILTESVHTTNKGRCKDLKKKCGKQSFIFEHPPIIKAWASIAGKKEGEGPLAAYYDSIISDSYLGEKTWEQAEKRLQQLTFETLLKKTTLDIESIDFLLSGDLLNQCVGSSMTVNNLNIPHIGLYGACSTMSESLLLSAMFVDGSFGQQVVAMTSSHFASSERQYRFPLGYGGQRTPTSQWTVTGAGAALVCSDGKGPKITACTIGNVVDWGIKDANNMGVAMAPAAFSTLKAHFSDLSCTVADYDLIVTGDLGQIGKEALLNISRENNLCLSGKLTDCGCLVFDNTMQDVHAGGSGCGCSAIALCGYLLRSLQEKKYKRILFCGTGALLSPTSVQQGLSVPGICHAVSIESEE